MIIVEDLRRMESIDNLNNKYSEYSYRIIKDKVTFTEGERHEIQSYGIEIERKAFQDGKLVKLERDMIKSISPHRHKVQELCKMLYDSIVSPIHLIDILGEYIDEYITDFDEILKDIYIC